MSEPEPREIAGRHGARASILTALAVVAVIVGVTVARHEADKPRPPGKGHQVTVAAYFLGRTAIGQRLFLERHTLGGVTVSNLQAAVAETLGDPDDPDYHSGFPAGTTVEVTDRGLLVNLDFDKDVVDAHAVGGDPAMALQALVWTVDQTTERPVPVTFSVDGKPASTILGLRVPDHLAERPAPQVMAPVSIDLEEGSTLTRNALILGSADPFGRTVTWQLRQGERVVDHGRIVTGECCQLAPYTLTLKDPPGSYTLVIRDQDPAVTRGGGASSDSKDIEIG